MGALKDPSCGARPMFDARGHRTRKFHTMDLEVVDNATV